jgi:hypothetical protein
LAAVSSTRLSSAPEAAARGRRLPAPLARPWVAYAVLFALAALLSGVTMLWGINPHDEGLVLQAGARIADGQLPYRDFYANYGPGPYFLSALQDLVFGPSLLTWRVVRVGLDATVAVLAFALARRDAPVPLALGAWLAAAAAMAFPSIPSPNPPAIALGLGAILLTRRTPAGAGALAGLAVVFRVDAGLAAVAGVAIAAFADRGLRAAVRSAIAAGIVAAALLAPVVLAAPREFWDQTLGFALDEQGLQRLPLPGAWDGGFEPNRILHHYIPYVLLGAAALWAVLAFRSRAPLRLWAPAPLALAGVAYLLARADDFHLIPLAAVLPVLLATVAARERGAGHTAGFAAACAALALIVADGLDQKRIQALHPPGLAPIEVDVADGVEARAGEAGALSALVPFVRARVPAGAPVFVANPRYDAVNVGNPLLYVLLDRPNPTRYDVMQPGVVTTAAVQREMVRDLERARPAVVVRWLSPLASAADPSDPPESSGVRILERWLARRYSEVERFGEYAVLVPATR